MEAITKLVSWPKITLFLTPKEFEVFYDLIAMVARSELSNLTLSREDLKCALSISNDERAIARDIYKLLGPIKHQLEKEE